MKFYILHPGVYSNTSSGVSRHVCLLLFISVITLMDACGPLSMIGHVSKGNASLSLLMVSLGSAGRRKIAEASNRTQFGCWSAALFIYMEYRWTCCVACQATGPVIFRWPLDAAFHLHRCESLNLNSIPDTSSMSKINHSHGKTHNSLHYPHPSEIEWFYSHFTDFLWISDLNILFFLTSTVYSISSLLGENLVSLVLHGV